MTALCLLPVLLLYMVTSSDGVLPCKLRVNIARAEQTDEHGRKCWDNVKVPACGGRCDSREISDWEFPFKKSYHPVCVYGGRRPLMVRLRFCDPGVATGTDVFHYIAAEDCRCKVPEYLRQYKEHSLDVILRIGLDDRRSEFRLNDTEYEHVVCPLKIVTFRGIDALHLDKADQVCSSEYTSCEWLPPNSTLLDGIYDFEDMDEE